MLVQQIEKNIMPDTVEKLFKVNKQGITVIRETVRPVKAAQVNNEAAKREVTAECR